MAIDLNNKAEFDLLEEEIKKLAEQNITKIVKISNLLSLLRKIHYTFEGRNS